MSFAFGSGEWGAADAAPDNLGVWRTIARSESRPVWLARWEAFKPGSASKEPVREWGAGAWGEWTAEEGPIEESLIFRASTLGYASRPTDAEGVILWPALLRQAVSVDRVLGLEPWSGGAGLSWGDLELEAPAGTWDADVESTNTDGRKVTVYLGAQTYDADRGLWLDPSSRDLAVVFAGLCGDWSLDEETLRLPVRDWTALLERPWANTIYGGSGGAEGTADLAGQPKPWLRGAAREITPVLIDPTNRIYQYADGPTTLVQVYERGYAGFTDAGDVADYAALVAASPAAGAYVSAEAVGMFKLGATPAGAITVDAQGSFPVAGYKSGLADIARYILTEDMGLPSEAIDTAAFSGLAIDRSWTGGIWSGQGESAVEIIARLLRSLGARLLPARTGRLRPYLVQAPGTLAAADKLTTAQIIRVEAVALPQNLAPPPYRIRVGYDRRYTTQGSDLSSSLSAARVQELARPWSTAAWASGEISQQYRNPSTPPLVETCLDTDADAQALADVLGGLWGAKRYLFDVDVPVAVGMPRDLGDSVAITYPLGPLRNGALAVVVGQTLRSAEDIVTLRVLV